MSEQNNHTISDQKLRQLLELHILTSENNYSNNQSIINMEAQYVYNSEQFNVPSIPSENQLIQKLQGMSSKATHLKWLFTTLIIASIGTGIYFYPKNQVATFKPHQAFTAVSESPLALESNALKSEPKLNTLLLPLLDVEKQDEKTSPFTLDSIPQFSLNTSPIMPLHELESPLPPPLEMTDDIPTYGVFKSNTSKLKIDTLFKNIQTLIVYGKFCEVRVSKGNDNETRMLADIESDDNKDKNGLRYQVTYERLGSTLKVSIEMTKSNALFSMNLSSKLTGKLDFVTDLNTSLLVQNTSGTISATGLSSPSCKLDCNYGNIQVDNLSTSLKMATKSGNIQAKAIIGSVNSEALHGNQTFSNIEGNLDLHNASGDVSMSDINGDIKTNVQHGNISLSESKGNLNINSSSGNISLSNTSGKTTQIRSAFGNISINNATSDIHLESSSGDLTLNHILGNVSVSGKFGAQNYHSVNGNVQAISKSGDISLTNCIGKIELEVTFGNVKVLQSKGKMNIDIGSGNIQGSDIEIEESLTINATNGNTKIGLLNAVETLSFDIETTRGTSTVQTGNLNLRQSKGKLTHEGGTILIRCYTKSGDQTFI